MKDLFKILAELEKRQVYFCIQSQGKNSFTNLSVDDTKGRNHSFSHKDSDEVEKWLKVMWGHVLSDMHFSIAVSREDGPIITMPQMPPPPMFR